jgi:hypothetical protein
MSLLSFITQVVLNVYSSLIKALINIQKPVVLFLIVTAPIITFSQQDKRHAPKRHQSTKNQLAAADSIIYYSFGPSVAPQYRRDYTISVTPMKLQLQVSSNTILLHRSWPFTAKRFREVVARFKNLRKQEQPGGIPAVGGGSNAIALYKKGTVLFEGNSYNRNFTGADINLDYLIPELRKLINSTQQKRGM